MRHPKLDNSPQVYQICNLRGLPKNLLLQKGVQFDAAPLRGSDFLESSMTSHGTQELPVLRDLSHELSENQQLVPFAAQAVC